MASKTKLIIELYDETLKDITSNASSWVKFLNSATWNFGYNFSEKVCIYAQRPDAIACATIEDWNKKAKRWLNAKSKGIALLEEKDGITRLKFVFDVSDTHQYHNNREYKLWSVEERYIPEIINSLETRFGTLEFKNNLAEAIYSSVAIAVEDNIQDYLDELKECVIGSDLQNFEESVVEEKFRKLLVSNIAYMTMIRCNVDPKDYFTINDFSDLKYFNTYDTIIRLGNATSDITQMEISEIKRTVQNLQKNEKNINHTFANENIKEYSNNENERRVDIYGNQIQRTGRLSNTRLEAREEGQRHNNWKIRQNEIELSKGEQTGIIPSIIDERPINRTLDGNSETSNRENRENRWRISQEREFDRGNETEQSNGMGGTNEQLENDSRGDSSNRVDLQLEDNDTTDNENIQYEPVNIEIPTINEQLSFLEQAEVNNNTSVFSFTQEMIDNCILEGSHFVDGKYRIYEQFLKSYSSSENITFLKNEYGMGGVTSIKGFDGISESYDAKGITLERGYGDLATKKLYNWKYIEQRIRELIRLDRYLTAEEKNEYQRYLEEKDGVAVSEPITNKEDNNKTLEERLLEFETEYDIFDTSNPEDEYKEIPRTLEMVQEDLKTKSSLKAYINYYQSILVAEDKPESELSKNLSNFIEEMNDLLIEKSNLIQGSVIYLVDNETRYIVNSIDKEKDIVNLLDFELYMNKQIIEHLEIPYTEFRELYLTQDQNFIDDQFSIVTSVNAIVNEIPPPEQREPLTNYILNEEISDIQHNFRIDNDNLGEGTPKEKVRRNIDAIKVLKRLDEDNRLATKEEQEILSQYVGWGGLPDVFDEQNASWHSEYLELKNLLTDEEYNSARASTLTAFYTPPIVIKAMYQTLENMGFKTGNILEPSCGIGNFIGAIPEQLANSKIYGIELDSITGKIAKQLYQTANIKVQGFETVDLPDSFFDVAIGNVPFGDFKVLDKRYEKNKFLIHDYFFAKAIDKVRPNGVIAFITSKGTMDKDNSSFRKYIAQRADLIGAIRLPNNAFSKNAGTKVTSDIIFLKKREKITDIEPDWVNLDVNEDGITMNKYFVDNPNMILGNMEMESTRFGMDSTCVADETISLEDRLANAITNIKAEIEEYDIDDINSDEEEKSILADSTVRNFSYTLVDGDVYYRINSKMYYQDLPLTSINRIKGMILLRDCVRNLIELQTEDYPDETIKAEQQRLNGLYDSFTKQYGLINSRANNNVFYEDSSYYLLCSLEVLDENGQLKRKADMFNKRTIKPHKEVTKVDTSSEALIVSVSEKAKVDLEYMQQLTGKSKDEIINDLQGVIFKVPTSNDEEEKYVTADEYLSGNIREKLRFAKLAVESNPEYEINVKYLEQTLPKPLGAGEISVRLGATWLPTSDIQDFMFELLETPTYARRHIKVHYSDYTSEWNVEGKNYNRENVKANTTYGTSRVNAYKIIEETLNLKDVRVFDTIYNDDGSKDRVLNKKETAVAQAKQEQIKNAFQNWIWKDQARRERLVELYNEKFNSIRPREYNGQHISFDGINPEIHLRPHQVNAIARVLYGGNTLLAHEVGAGKTFEMVASAMESKRLNLCNKSLFVVPNHIIEQFASEFLQLYPSANILVATKKDFATNNRKKFCSKIATGEYDAIIIGHSQFERIPMSAERQKAILQQQINEVLVGIQDLKSHDAERYSIKQLEKTKKSLELKLNKLNDQSKKDDVVTFEQLGCDRLFVDESHYYKNLFLYTKMRNVGGIAQTEAQKSSDLFMKCRYLDELTGGRGIVFATGTPISNSMVEMYTMQRYLQYGTLEKNNLQHFDAWASTFGETVTAIELAPEGTGYRTKTRLAKFYNLPELVNMFKEVADIQTSEMLKLPVPEAEYHNVVVKPSEIQEGMVAELAERAELIRQKLVDAHQDNMLKITNDGRKLALDQRLINPLLEDFENSKVNVCADNIFKIWKETEDEKLTQLAFCDLSTPKSLGADDNRYEMELVDGKWKLKDRIFTDVYTDLKRKLIQKGIPENQIAFIHDADTEAKKKELFAKVRKGEIRVLMGSTQKMGAGTNCQDKLVALHDLDCPWRPSDLIQRSGRIIRQGNSNKLVHIFRYVTEKTFDAYMFQLVENKQKMISQIMTSKTPVRSAEDVDETALSYAEIKALASGNPKILEKTNLDSEVSKLTLLKQEFLNQKYQIEDKLVKYFPQQIARLDAQIGAMEEDTIKLTEYTKPNLDGFSPMKIDGIIYTEKEIAGKKFLETMQNIKSMESKEIGEYRGFKMNLSFDSLTRNFRLTLKNKFQYSIDLGTDAYGNITRINNCLDGIEKQIPTEREKLDDMIQQFENAKVEAQKEFPQESELQEKSKRLDELNIELNMNEKVDEIIDDADVEIEKDKQKDDRNNDR